MNANKYIARTTQITVLPEGDDLFRETSTTVSITDEAGGEFVTVVQEREKADGSAPKQEIAIDPTEWPAIRSAIDRLVKGCKE